MSVNQQRKDAARARRNMREQRTEALEATKKETIRDDSGAQVKLGAGSDSKRTVGGTGGGRSGSSRKGTVMNSVGGLGASSRLGL
tara:strand:+ start:13427 stop:13681 length:255 start_codon:yes stop_codon:yes gene_type:complete